MADPTINPHTYVPQINEFGIKRPRAMALIKHVAAAVDQWTKHFRLRGVCPADIEQLAASIDRDALKWQRQALCCCMKSSGL